MPVSSADSFETTPDELVRTGRDRYLAENSLSTASYTAKRFPIYLGSRPIYLPNPDIHNLRAYLHWRFHLQCPTFR